MTIPTPPGLEAVMHELVFSHWDPEFLKTPAARRAIDDVVFARFQSALRFSIPWLARSVDLAGATVVEVGCGSGSSTAALAMHAAKVVGVDIDADSVRAAAARCAAYGLENVTVYDTSPDEMLERAVAVADADVYVLYAVLEHQTYTERLDTLRTLWDRLPPAGSLVIIETPNRLTYEDHHTSEMPFFHMLPDDLAFAYMHRVPRLAFRDTMLEILRTAPETAWERRIRWGLGASFHEFELAFDEPLDEIIVADGFEQEMLDFFPGGLDEQLLIRFFLERLPDVPIGFARSVLNLILRKPASPADRSLAATLASERRRTLASAQATPPSAPFDAVPGDDRRAPSRSGWVLRTQATLRRLSSATLRRARGIRRSLGRSGSTGDGTA